VSSLKTSRTPRGLAALGARARDAAIQAAPLGKRAGTTAVQGVRQGVHGAREWAAPRLEDAADAVTASVAPRVSAALRSTASRVRPESARTGVRRLLGWRWLAGVGAAIAAAGAVAAIAMRRRSASATAEAGEATESPASEPARPDEAASEAATADEAAGSDVNGQKAKSRR
jgi:hypothetical protein